MLTLTRLEEELAQFSEGQYQEIGRLWLAENLG